MGGNAVSGDTSPGLLRREGRQGDTTVGNTQGQGGGRRSQKEGRVAGGRHPPWRGGAGEEIVPYCVLRPWSPSC